MTGLIGQDVVLRRLIAEARARLSALEATYASDLRSVDLIRSMLFCALSSRYRKRDQLRMLIAYQEDLLRSLLRARVPEGAEPDADEGDDEAEGLRRTGSEARGKSEHAYERDREELWRRYQEALEESDQAYAETAIAVSEKRDYAEVEREEIVTLYRKLVRLYHPDRFAGDPVQRETYDKLMRAINQARNNGDLATLRAIANDPDGYIRRQGWHKLDFEDSSNVEQMKQLLKSLRRKIREVETALRALHRSEEYKLWRQSEDQPDFLDTVTQQRAADLDAEIVALEIQSAALAEEIRRETP